VEETVN